MSKVIFITGATGGFGSDLAFKALERGDKVVVTARATKRFNEFDKYGDNAMCIRLDVSDRRRVFEAVDAAVAKFGRIDVGVSCAANIILGAMEEVSESELRKAFDVTTFGSVWLWQALLPVMRKQGGGHLIQFNSSGGFLSPAMCGPYASCKHALVSIMNSFAEEIAPFNIKVTNIEPDSFNTTFKPNTRFTAEMPEYDFLRNVNTADLDPEAQSGIDQYAFKDENLGTPVLKIIDSAEPPKHITFGNNLVREKIATQLNSIIEEQAKWADYDHFFVADNEDWREKFADFEA